MIVLSDEEIKAMLTEKVKVIERFPFMAPARNMVRELGTCAPCQRGAKGKQLNNMVHDIQKHIAAMAESDRQDLKRLLGGSPIRLFYLANQNGNTVRRRLDF